MSYSNLKQFLINMIPVGILITILSALYIIATVKHIERSTLRLKPVSLTTGCKTKLDKYQLKSGKYYISPYVTKQTGKQVQRAGYRPEDIRAIQRGCNIIDDLLGQDAKHISERWNSRRYIRGTHTSCDHCHQSIGDKQNAKGERLVGSLSLAASWVKADAYDRFTGLLLPYELRQMQCFINSSNGFKPNISDDIIRDITAYTRFLSVAVNLRTQHRYPEQGIDEIPVSATAKRGDDYVRGASLFRLKCANCHGARGFGTVINGRVIYPAVGGPNAFNRQSRNNFRFVSTILPGFICRNMPLGQEGTLSNQDCRDIAYFISNMPRPAGDKAGPLAALWQQMMMAILPRLVALVNQDEETKTTKPTSN